VRKSSSRKVLGTYYLEEAEAGGTWTIKQAVKRSKKIDVWEPVPRPGNPEGLQKAREAQEATKAAWASLSEPERDEATKRKVQFHRMHTHKKVIDFFC
jgi:beta-xylosidase